MKNSLTSLTPFLAFRTLAICGVIGFVFGNVMPLIDLPWIGVFVCYFAGLFVGRFLTRFIDGKLGRNIGTTIVFGLLIGMSLSPLRFLPLAWGMCLTSAFSQGTDVFGGLGCIVSSMFSPVVFVIGVMRPTVWGERF